MTPERYEKVYQIVTTVLDLESGKRGAYLDGACGDDPGLLAEVDDMLQNMAEADSTEFLESTPVKISLEEEEELKNFIGQRIGPYTVRELIGRGGQSNVYLATRDEPYQEEVAIKILERGLNTEEILRRFKQEVQIQIALSAHHNIARLLDAGETDDHRPYLVMEYVKGLRIDHYCDAHKLSVQERIRLFHTVCEAIKYAHTHLIIHRDLKPSNILVTKEGVPKLLDFGIAKLLDPQSGSAVGTQTLPEHRILTPEYASPEQFQEDAVLTTATDGYSLGIVLYELLTGHRPYQFESRLRKEIERVVCEVAPEKPRSVISRPATIKSEEGSTKTITPEEIGARRSCQLKTLWRQLSSDLETILMYALQKDSHQRYESIEKFSVDLHNWLEQKPLEFAKKPTRAERVRYWCRRHREAVVFMALVGALFLLSSLLWYESAQKREVEKMRTVERIARRDETLRSCEYVAGLVASIINNRLEKLRNVVNEVGESPKLRSLLMARDQTGLNKFIKEIARSRIDQDGNYLFETSVIYDPKGIMLAHSLTPELVGKDFSFRDYIRGALRLAKETGGAPVYISRLHLSQSQHIYKFHIARAVRTGGKEGEIIGVFQISITTSQSMGLPHILDSRYKVVLVGPWDMNPAPGEPILTSSHIVVLHPTYPEPKQGKPDFKPANPIAFPQEQFEILKGGKFEDYRDPVGEKDPLYRGRWLVGSAPVKSAREFVVIVQVKYKEAFPTEHNSPQR
jgi:serine/threonine protein kinase